MGGKASYCTFGPRARTVIYEFSDFCVLWQYAAVYVLGCILSWMSKGGNPSYCTFGPRARTVIYEFSDFGVLWEYTAVHVQM